jgi:hypothetical protein
MALALSPALDRPQPLKHFQLVERLGGEEQTFQLPRLQDSQGSRLFIWRTAAWVSVVPRPAAP